MKIKFLRGYVSKNGNPTFVHSVHGTDEQLAQYKEVLGENFREDEESGLPLFFDNERRPDDTVLALRKDGKKFYAQTELVSARVQAQIDKLEALNHMFNKGTNLNPRLLATLSGALAE